MKISNPLMEISCQKYNNELEQALKNIEQFYYREAWMLDNQKFEDWLSVFDTDVRYFMPIRRNHMRDDNDLEYSGFEDFAHFDEDLTSLQGRVRKHLYKTGWAENPPSRTRHMISNVFISSQPENDTYIVSSAFFVYRNRLERQVDTFVGERRDLLRRDQKSKLGFKIASRTILLDQSTILSNNISLFF